MNQSEYVKVKPKCKELFISKILVFFGMYSIVLFMLWLMDSSFKRDNFLYVIIMISILYKVISLLIEWLLIWHPSVPEKPILKRAFTVDVLTTYVNGEPKEMIKNSLMAIKSISYPHETFLCDEANDAELREFCIQNDIHHVTREKKINAKAGNINNALQKVARGEIVLILDPDHIVFPNFLDEVLPFFEDEKIGFVQVVQAYYNQDDAVIAKAAADQTYQFYGPLMMTLNSYGAVPVIGANCTFRRTALDSIGGHAPGLTEDMHTALRLKAKGWKSVYNPVIVAKGLVPWNYSGYCLQQLKWSRGTFDLLYHVFPKLAKNLSWSERFAFLAIPFFYFQGLIAFIDFLIPIIALTISLIPINLNVVEFMIYSSQLYFISQGIRFYHQKWYFEKHEKGTALLGGVLFKSTWWCTTLGFFYSLINKKVPYIPTPKDFRLETPWKLLIPNFLIIGISLFAIIYGLIKDYTPFSLFMAFLAFLNILVLGFGNLMAMQKQIVFIHNLFQGSFITKGSSTRKFIFRVKHSIYNLSTRNFVVGSFLFFIILLNVAIIKLSPAKIDSYITSGDIGQRFAKLFKKNDAIIYKRNYGQLYGGIENEEGLEYYKTKASFVRNTFYLNSLDSESLKQFLDSCYSNNMIPFLSLSVDTSYSQALVTNYTVSSLMPVYEEIKNRNLPIIMMFDRNNKMVSDDLYASFYEKSYYMADSMAIHEIITWVWNSADIDKDNWLKVHCWTTEHMIDWIYSTNEVVLQCENSYYGRNRAGIDKPLLVNSSNIQKVEKNKVENENFEKNVVGIIGVQSGNAFHLTFNLKELNRKPPKQEVHRLRLPEYVKGVAYNPMQGRGNSRMLPLTVEKLHADFSLIKQMGCNTIRRFSPSIYDYNLLKTIKEYDLDVLYGFWFEPWIDFYKDSLDLIDHKKEVLKAIQNHKSDTSIVCWGLGNETWNNLKIHYGKPYLSVVRSYYLKFINNLIDEIKPIDSSRPIYSTETLNSASMCAFTEYMPQIDFIGINPYYDENISKMQTMVKRYLNGMPYLVSEYGNKGYWDKGLSDFDDQGRLIEQTSMQKARDYMVNWNRYIFSDRENNFGGVAFCWQDKYEQTATWFGIIDIYGNKKPAYHALKEIYTSNSQKDSLVGFPIPEFKIIVDFERGSTKKIKAKAVTENSTKNLNLKFKWIVFTDENFKTIKETDFKSGQTDFSFSLPDKKAPYRIYLYVKDDLGNGITETLPVNSF